MSDTERPLHTERPVNSEPAAAEPVVERDRPVVADEPVREGSVVRDEPVLEPATRRIGTEPVVAEDAATRRVPVAEPVGPTVGDPALRDEVVARERERFGGVKAGSAFFGWLTATGMAVLLTALVAAAGAAVGLAANGTPQKAAGAANANSGTIGLIGAIAVAVILFVSYFCGGYVAGRMARFDGLRQGLAVWLWAVVIAIVVAILSAVAGTQFDILGNLNSFPRIPQGTVTVAGIITAVIVAIISLIGALLGGVAGMAYHRRVDRVGLGL